MKTILFTIFALVSNQALADANAFSGVGDQKPVCYGREYGIDQLKAKPLQTVQKIQAKLEHIDTYNQNLVTLEMTIKGEKNKFTNYRAMFTCQADNTCIMDCDGGSVNMKLSENGSLILENKNFVITGGCGNKGKDFILKSVVGGDDKFDLVKLPAEFCQNVVDYNQ
jgi:hypothetical protein